MVFQPIIHQHWCVLIVLLCGVIKTLYDIYSLMLVGRVERIFTRVGGTQLQSLAHPPRGRDLVSELWWDVMLTWLFCIFEGEQLALTQVWCKSTSFLLSSSLSASASVSRVCYSACTPPPWSCQGHVINAEMSNDLDPWASISLPTS